MGTDTMKYQNAQTILVMLALGLSGCQIDLVADTEK